MVKLKFFIFIAFLGAALVGVGCKKLQKKKEYTLKPEFKEYFKFGELSQWNYNDQVSSSVAITHELLKYAEGIMDLGEARQEFFEYELKAVGGRNLLFRAISDVDNVNRLGIFVFDTAYKTVAEVYYMDGGIRPYYGDDDKVISHPTYNVNGKTFENVFELELGASPYFSKLYFAKNVGIIQMDDRKGNQYFLKSYALK